MRPLISILIWPFAGLIVGIAKFIGLFVVPVALARDWDMAVLPIWGNTVGIPASYNETAFKRWWWYAIRNGAGNLHFGIMPAPEQWVQYGDIDESKPGFQWRWRRIDIRSSFRLAWGKPDPQKGKNEFYIGMVLNDDSPYVGMSFFQLRPAWLILIPLLAWWAFS